MNLIVHTMTAQDEDYVLPRVELFYHSDAVDHTVPAEVLRETFVQAVSDNPLIEGFILYTEGGERLGYAYITHLFASEAGKCIMIEELYIDPEHRGNGYGKAFFNWLFAAYPDTARFRLEVTPENPRAQKLYERMGFTVLDYRQMIRGR